MEPGSKECAEGQSDDATLNERQLAYLRLTILILAIQEGTNPAGDGVVHRSEILDAVLGPEA